MHSIQIKPEPTRATFIIVNVKTCTNSLIAVVRCLKYCLKLSGTRGGEWKCVITQRFCCPEI